MKYDSRFSLSVEQLAIAKMPANDRLIIVKEIKFCV
jgi:hypothetical protein